jgi:hypothetical protein
MIILVAIVLLEKPSFDLKSSNYEHLMVIGDKNRLCLMGELLWKTKPHQNTLKNAINAQKFTGLK